MTRWWTRLQAPALERAARRWGWALAAALLGMGGVLWWGADAIEAHSQLQQQVQRLGGSAKAESRVSSTLPDAPDFMVHLPAPGSADHLGLALQEGLLAQGLQVLAMRPQALQTGGPLPSQPVALRWQGRFSDFSQAWASLVDAGPVWTLDRLTVVPGASADQLQWDGVWRAWLRPDAATEQAWPAGWVTSPRSGLTEGFNPFVTAASVSASEAMAAEAETSAALPADPHQWPVSAIRLVGVWQQADRVQAVLSAGAHWVVLGAGAPLAREGYRIRAVYPESVELQPRRSAEPVRVLRLEGG